MCGLCGKVCPGGLNNRSLGWVEEMNAQLVHRGPDDVGIYRFPDGALAHRRLSIIDLNTGHQPIFNEDETVAVTLNGEIYNYLDLREWLQLRGHTFTTNSDTEVIAHLYEEIGDNFVKRLHGMFAIALWDDKRKRLVLARDRVGKKPIFYIETDGGIAYASEIKALLKDISWTPRVKEEAVLEYLSLGYVPAPGTIYQNVYKLPPGSLLSWEDGKVTISRYWEVKTLPKHVYLDEEVLLDDLDKRLREAVRLRLISDVPIGAFLSGGIDSSLVVAMMAQLSSEPVRTFAIGFPQSEYNELPYAAEIARQYGTRHTEFMVEPDAAEILPDLVWHLDEPFADTSALPSYYVSKLAREHVAVALNGDGGDELFGGYTRMRTEFLAQKLGFIPAGIRILMRTILPAHPKSAVLWQAARLRLLLDRSLAGFEERYLDFHRLFDIGQMSSIISPDLLRSDNGTGDAPLRKALNDSAGLESFDRCLLLELNLYLPDDLLVKADRMAMAHGLEGRSPLLDQELIGWAMRLPIKWKLRRQMTKYILRKLACRYLPDRIAYRKKRGFSLPIDDWLRTDLRDFSHDLLFSKRALERGYLQEIGLRRLVDAHEAGERHGKRIWALIMLELWHRQFVDGLPS